MKTRLEIAKRLLSRDGAIYVQLDYHQAHYAKVLMDEVFGEDNFQREIIWRIGWLSGYKTADKNWIRNHDTILFYSKDSGALKFGRDDNLHPCGNSVSNDFVRVVTAVCQQRFSRYPLNQMDSFLAISSGTFCNKNSDWHTIRIHGQMYFGIEPPFVRDIS